MCFLMYTGTHDYEENELKLSNGARRLRESLEMRSRSCSGSRGIRDDRRGSGSHRRRTSAEGRGRRASSSFTREYGGTAERNLLPDIARAAARPEAQQRPTTQPTSLERDFTVRTRP